MQFHKISTILIWSENAKTLSDWYKNSFNLKVVSKLDHPQDTGVLFSFPGGALGSGSASTQKFTVKAQTPTATCSITSIPFRSVPIFSQQRRQIFAPPFKAPTMENISPP
jgi:hypothetical protein